MMKWVKAATSKHLIVLIFITEKGDRDFVSLSLVLKRAFSPLFMHSLYWVHNVEVHILSALHGTCVSLDFLK
jgi:hypothetical protein